MDEKYRVVSQALFMEAPSGGNNSNDEDGNEEKEKNIDDIQSRKENQKKERAPNDAEDENSNDSNYDHAYVSRLKIRLCVGARASVRFFSYRFRACVHALLACE